MKPVKGKGEEPTQTELSKTTGISPPRIEHGIVKSKDWFLFKKYLLNRCHELTLTETIVAAAYLENAQSYCPTVTQTAREVGISTTRASKAFKKLVSRDMFIEVGRRGFCPGRRTPIYRITTSIVEHFYIWKEHLHNTSPTGADYILHQSVEVVPRGKEYLNNTIIKQESFLSMDELDQLLGEDSGFSEI